MKRSFIHQFSLKLFTTLAFAALTFGIPSCSPCGGVDPYFDITEINVTNYNTTRRSEIDKADSVFFADYNIRCSYAVVYHTNNSTTTPNLFGVNTTYALSCIDPGHEGSKEGIDSLIVISNKDFNDNFKAGDTLSSISFIKDWSDFIPLSEFVSINKESIRSTTFDLRFTQFPSNTSEAHTFTIILKLANGEEHRATTPEVYFK